MYLLKHITLEHGSKEIILLNQDSEERLIAWLDKQPDEGIEDYFISDSIPYREYNRVTYKLDNSPTSLELAEAC